MDFDQYSREVRDADVAFVLTHRETANWRLIRTEMLSISLQFGSDGGGSISDGITRNDAAVLIWRVGASPEDIYLNGGLIGNDELAVLEPGSHFIFASKGPRQWISVALPVCNFGAELASLGSSTRAIILSSPGSAEQLSLLATDLYRAFISGVPSEALNALEMKLIAGSLGCLSKSARPATEHHLSFSTVDMALKTLHNQDWLNCRVDDLCVALGLSERTLLRAFHRIVGMGPKRYLMLRQLNLIRRVLRDASHEDRHVTEVLTDWGISELGRFSGQYKNLFGELPSETLRTVSSKETIGRSARC